MIAAIAIGPILWVIHNLSYYYKVNENGPGGLAHIGNCIWYCYGAVLQQGDHMRELPYMGRPQKFAIFDPLLSPPCPHLGLISTIKFTQPPLLRPLFHDPLPL